MAPNFVAIGSMQPEINAGMIRLRRALADLGAALDKKEAPAERSAGAEVQGEECPGRAPAP